MENVEGHIPEEDDWLPVAPEQKEPLSKQQARLWALVLLARSIPGRIEGEGETYRLLVPAECLEEANRQLRLYERENRNWPPLPPPPHPTAENTLATLSVLLLLATFHNIVTMPDMFPHLPAPDWFGLGSAHAGRILGGEPWRIVTALTLHSDSLHLASNLAIGGIFVLLLCRELGSGLAWSLLLSAGALGNLVNAFLHQPEHTSIGASTAVFSCIGILAAINLPRYQRHFPRRLLLPVAAAMALLAAFGSEGERVDLGAHFFGFVYGIFLGVVTAWGMERLGRPPRLCNIVLILLSMGLVIAAWWLAIECGKPL